MPTVGTIAIKTAGGMACGLAKEPRNQQQGADTSVWAAPQKDPPHTQFEPTDKEAGLEQIFT